MRLTSHDAIHEPFIEFMLQLEWPNGRMLRQYTVLVDPPVTIAATPAVTAAPVVRAAAPAPAPVTYETPPPATTRPATTSPARSVTVPAAAPVADSYGPIRRSDTLWGIAKQLRPDESISTTSRPTKVLPPSTPPLGRVIRNLCPASLIRVESFTSGR